MNKALSGATLKADPAVHCIDGIREAVAHSPSGTYVSILPNEFCTIERTTRLMLRFAAIAIILLAPVSTNLSAAEQPATRSISVSGTGTVNARPDIASISVGVSSEAKTAREALDANTTAMTRVIADLKKQQIKAKDIQTTNFSVNPRYHHYKDGKPPVITGYRVVNAVTIIVRDLAKLGTILDQTVSQGSNQVNGIRFSIDKSQDLEDEARKRAITDARRKAELYAREADVQLGAITTISESSVSRPQPVVRRAAMQARSAPVPIEAGEQQITARVNVSWELK